MAFFSNLCSNTKIRTLTYLAYASLFAVFGYTHGALWCFFSLISLQIILMHAWRQTNNPFTQITQQVHQRIHSSQQQHWPIANHLMNVVLTTINSFFALLIICVIPDPTHFMLAMVAPGQIYCLCALMCLPITHSKATSKLMARLPFADALPNLPWRGIAHTCLTLLVALPINAGLTQAQIFATLPLLGFISIGLILATYLLKTLSDSCNFTGPCLARPSSTLRAGRQTNNAWNLTRCLPCFKQSATPRR